MNSLWLSESDNLKNINKNNIKDEKSKDIDTDICIIGAGIFGITCAYYLTNLGFKVTVLEKDSVGSKTTGHTTGKITSQHGLFYNYLTSSYNKKFAKDYLEVNEKAITNIKDIIDKEKIKCDFKIQNNYVYATNEKELDDLNKEQQTLDDLGFNSEFVTKTGLPFEVKGAICFKNQAQFNPIKYLDSLCKCITSKSGTILAETPAFDVNKEDNKCITYCNNFVVRSKFVIVATHYPFINFPRILFY